MTDAGMPASRARVVLAVLLAAMFIVLLDTSLVGVALPRIRAELGATGGQLAWILSGYLLAFGVVLIPAGRLGDRIGHRWVFLSGLIGFTLASVWSAAAPDAGQLVASRIVQGFAAGVFVPSVSAYIQLLFYGKARGAAYAAMGTVIGVASAIGPFLGGFVTDLSPDSWRLVFALMVPIGVVLIIGALILLPRRGELVAPGPRFDVVGLLLIVVGLTAVLVALILGQAGWSVPILIIAVGGLAVLVALAIWVRRVERAGGSPLIPPRLFHARAFRGGFFIALPNFAGLMSLFIVFSLFWQEGLGRSAFEAGVIQSPYAFGAIVGAAISGRLVDRFGRVGPQIGLLSSAAGLATTAILLASIGYADLQGWFFIAPFAFAGFGSGMSIGPTVRFAVSSVPHADAGAASGVMNTAQRVGGSLGIAVTATLFFALLGDAVRRGVEVASPEHYEFATMIAIAAAACFCTLALVVSFLLPRQMPNLT